MLGFQAPEREVPLVAGGAARRGRSKFAGHRAAVVAPAPGAAAVAASRPGVEWDLCPRLGQG